MLRVGSAALRNPVENHRTQPITAAQSRYAFGNTLTEEESQAAYERYAVPGPDHVLFQASFANFNPHATTTVDFRNDTRAPLLLIAGGKDYVAPASVTEANFKLYRKSSAVTDFKEFPDRSHFTIGEAGWEQVADYALDWAVARSLEPAA